MTKTEGITPVEFEALAVRRGWDFLMRQEHRTKTSWRATQEWLASNAVWCATFEGNPKKETEGLRLTRLSQRAIGISVTGTLFTAR